MRIIKKKSERDMRWSWWDITTCLVLRLSGRQGDILPIPTLLYLPYCCGFLDESKYLRGHLDLSNIIQMASN